VSWDEVLGDLGQSLAAMVSANTAHGPDSVAMYLATGFAYDSAAQVSAGAFMRTLGSSSFASAATVDNAPVLVAAELIAGHPMLNPVWDPSAGGVVVFIGTNPVVSHGYGTALPDPIRYLRDHRRLGGTVVVLDPRRTETAVLADLHLQTKPGSDVSVLAWLAAEVLRARDHGNQAGIEPADLDILASALAPFTLDRAAAAAGVDTAQLVDLRERIVGAEGRLAMFCGTGVTMARDGVLAEWMRWVLLALTDSLDRPGGMVFRRGIVNPLRRPKPSVHVAPPPRSRPDLPRVAGQLPAVALIDEIEAGNIRALILAGGNPIAALPQPTRVHRALAKLEVLATIDVVESEITGLATHVLPAVGQLERADVTLIDGVMLRTGIQSTRAVLEPVGLRRPVWWMFAQLARQMGWDILGSPGPHDLDDMDFLSSLFARGPLDATTVFEAGPRGIDLPGETGWVLNEIVPGGRWSLAPAQLVERLAAHRSPSETQVLADSLVLVPHRQQARSNSIGFRQADGAPSGTLIHPDDAARLGLDEGVAVTLRSAHGQIVSALHITEVIRQGVVSCSHGRGLDGTGRLVALDDIDPLTAMPVASGVPVTITRL
jgi:anaerobic selenocysteine-containing dehydrogenase